jgi:hypothetical protein
MNDRRHETGVGAFAKDARVSNVAMQPIDFYKLARPVQERFVGSVNGTGLPAPILRSPAKPMAPYAWLAASAASVIALFVVFRAGYGDLASPLAIESTIFLAIDAALVAAVVFGVLRALAIWREHRKSPFKRGIYVFPVGLIDARTPLLRMLPIEDLANVDGPDGKNEFTVTFGARSYRFPVRDGAQAEAAKIELASARGKIDEAGAARESVRPKAIAALDPLQGYANPLVSSEPLRPSAPPWARFGWVFALITGAVLGASIWAVHNAKSDDAMYDRAIAAKDVDSFRAYLTKGSRHKNEIGMVLLPRAELAAAVQVGNVDAIEKYIKDHPTTAIGPEVSAALKSAMKKELDAAIAAGTLGAVDDFTRKHPQSHLDAEIAAARHGVYAAALERYLTSAPAKGAAEAAFVERLLAFAEKKGPPVEIRFHREMSKTMDKADSAVAKNRNFKGVVSLPSRYFDAAHAKPHEDDLASSVVQRFGQAFPTEILAFAVGEPIADPEAPLPANVLVPTLFLEHGPTWTGSVVTGKNPNGVYVGLGLQYDALFRIPDDPKPLRVKLDVWKGPATTAAKGEDKPEELIYAKMQEEGLEQFKKKLLGSFFKTK